ncbi:hypothetical protein XU18_1162 [Perkinsela sp. CCAP 1560/4]|nr:hypothetical protein XU18_4957 [Perkinsela sp. CCAP 1560/4]KNH08307.1 hypothetical protein XU18_1162 [Perkinsela sp. CCAP 1560/4]|eukprot:KNH03687.1 hypothetical protein XU18_4957 [Perkinsela sp. CCAP 1560/4]
MFNLSRSDYETFGCTNKPVHIELIVTPFSGHIICKLHGFDLLGSGTCTRILGRPSQAKVPRKPLRPTSLLSDWIAVSDISIIPRPKSVPCKSMSLRNESAMA